MPNKIIHVNEFCTLQLQPPAVVFPRDIATGFAVAATQCSNDGVVFVYPVSLAWNFLIFPVTVKRLTHLTCSWLAAQDRIDVPQTSAARFQVSTENTPTFRVPRRASMLVGYEREIIELLQLVDTVRQIAIVDSYQPPSWQFAVSRLPAADQD